MEWFALGKNVYCAKCAEEMRKEEGELPFVKIGVSDNLECAKCKAKPLKVRKGIIVSLGTKERVFCPQCAKNMEDLILEKATYAVSLEDEDVSPTPLWCDSCGKPIPVAVEKESLTILWKTVEALEEIIFQKDLRASRPALWEKALQWKERLDDYLMEATENF